MSRAIALPWVVRSIDAAVERAVLGVLDRPGPDRAVRWCARTPSRTRLALAATWTTAAAFSGALLWSFAQLLLPP